MEKLKTLSLDDLIQGKHLSYAWIFMEIAIISSDRIRIIRIQIPFQIGNSALLRNRNFLEYYNFLFEIRQMRINESLC